MAKSYMRRARDVVSIMLVALILLATAGSAPAQEPEGVDPSALPQRGGICSSTLNGSGPSHPLQGITIKHSKELEGKEKDSVVRRVLQTPDVQNVLKGFPMKFDLTKAIVVMHTLDTGNTLLTVAIPAEKEALIYYELAKPLAERNPEGKGYKSLYKSQAMLLAIEGKEVKLISLSINGSPPRKAGIVPLGVPPCGNCTDIYNWTYESANCTSWDGGCLIGCGVGCVFCVFLCWECIASGTPWACGGCIWCTLVHCPYCIFGCCRHWEVGCVTCGTPP